MPDTPPSSDDVLALLRNRNYLVLLVVVAILGVPVAAAAYWFLYLVDDLQKWVFNPAYLLKSLGFHGEPIWWPLPVVCLAGGLAGLMIQYLPGRGGHSPADGLQVSGGRPPRKYCRASFWLPWPASPSAPSSGRRPLSSPWGAGWPPEPYASSRGAACLSKASEL